MIRCLATAALSFQLFQSPTWAASNIPRALQLGNSSDLLRKPDVTRLLSLVSRAVVWMCFKLLTAFSKQSCCSGFCLFFFSRLNLPQLSDLLVQSMSHRRHVWEKCRDFLRALPWKFLRFLVWTDTKGRRRQPFGRCLFHRNKSFLLTFCTLHLPRGFSPCGTPELREGSNIHCCANFFVATLCLWHVESLEMWLGALPACWKCLGSKGVMKTPGDVVDFGSGLLPRCC